MRIYLAFSPLLPNLLLLLLLLPKLCLLICYYYCFIFIITQMFKLPCFAFCMCLFLSFIRSQFVIGSEAVEQPYK
jgi:hypothetical protein